MSKVADGATPGHWKALIRMIKYILDTKEKCLKIEPKMGSDNLFYMEGISDSKYSGDKDTRISVYGGGGKCKYVHSDPLSELHERVFL